MQIQSVKIQRYGSGIKLLSDTAAYRFGIPLEQLFTLPSCLYFEDVQGTLHLVNNAFTQFYGNHASSSTLGHSCYQSLNKLAVIHKEAYAIFHEVIYKNNKSIDMLSIKFPWYNDENKIIGILNCEYQINLSRPSSIIEATTQIVEVFTRLNLINHHSNKTTTDLSCHFTMREIDVINLVLRGKTMREIADIIGLSVRTVESYFETIKKKADVKSKSQFIEKAINNAWC